MTRTQWEQNNQKENKKNKINEIKKKIRKKC